MQAVSECCAKEATCAVKQGQGWREQQRRLELRQGGGERQDDAGEALAKREAIEARRQEKEQEAAKAWSSYNLQKAGGGQGGGGGQPSTPADVVGQRWRSREGVGEAEEGRRRQEWQAKQGRRFAEQGEEALRKAQEILARREEEKAMAEIPLEFF